MAVMDRIARHTLLGGEVDVMDVGQLMAFVSDCAAARRRTVIANHNLNSLRLIRREPAMAALYARAERIHAAMTVRGFRGEYPLGGARNFSLPDLAWLLAWLGFFLFCRLVDIPAAIGALAGT